MVSIGDITGRIVIKDTGSPAVTQFARSVDLSVKQVEISGNRLSAVVEGMLSKAALLATAGVAVRAGFRFLKESAVEAMEAERAFAQLRAGVESTGGAAGKSAEELSAMADELSRLTGFDDELIAGGEAILLTFRRVRGEAFEQTMKLALDLSARFGKDIDSSVIMIAKALDMLMAGSAKGLSALSKAGVTFTDQQKKTMEQLVKTGQAAEAQRMFFAELEAQFGGSAIAARDTMGGALAALAVSWGNLKENVGTSGAGIRVVIEGLIKLIDTWADGWLLLDLGATVVMTNLVRGLGTVELGLRKVLELMHLLSMRGTLLNPLAGDEQKAKSVQGYLEAQQRTAESRAHTAKRIADLESEAHSKVAQILGILPKVQSKYSDIAGEVKSVGSEIDNARAKQRQWFDDLYANLTRQTQALSLLQQGMRVEQIENLVESAAALGRTNLLDPLVLKAALIKDKIDAIAGAFELADQAKKKFAESGGDLDKLISKQFETVGGSSDPQMQKLLETLREAKTLSDSVKTDEQRRIETVARAVQLYEQFNGKVITHAELQRIILANADQWVIELSEAQIIFDRIFERLSAVADAMAHDLVASWRHAWEENESITEATLDSLKHTLLNVVQDIISQWLSQWFRAMAAWLARWIATQRIAQASTASMSAGATGAGSGLGSLFGIGSQVAGTQGATAGALAGWASAAFALYVVYKGFIEDHKRKFARVEIADGQANMTAWHGKKYMQGVQQAAESIIANVTKFLDEIDVTMERLGTVIIESSKSGFNVAIPGSMGVLFKSMEEAISYAQILMVKYGQFADSVSFLVQSVIRSTKAMTIEALASDIAFAKELETQNLEEAAVNVQRAMDLAIAQWKRAEDLFLSFFDSNLPAFAEAAMSILTRLSNSLWSTYNQLAGIEEDPEEAWQRQKAAFNAQRALVLAQLKLWALEIDARIKNFKVNALWLGGIGTVTEGTLKFVAAMVQTAEVLDPALQALYDIQKLINDAIAGIPPELTDADFPGTKGKGKGRRSGAERDSLRDEIAALEAEVRGPLHSALFDLNLNIKSFRDRAKDAKLPAEEIARAVELMTIKFQQGLRRQAEAFAGFGTDFTRRLIEIDQFFDEVRELGRKQSGMPNWLVKLLEGEALDKLGVELNAAINQFAGLVDPMIAINTQAETLRQNVIAYAEAVGWSSEQIDAAMRAIDQGIEFQRQQGINSLLDRLFAYAKQAGLYQEQAVEFERQKALLDIAIIEAQLTFYGAMTSAIEEMITGIRGFINSDAFNYDNRSNEVLSVRIVEDEADIFTDLFDNIIAAVENWREAIKDFAEATQDLLTDEALSGLTQQQQLEFARSRVEELIAKANTGDLKALAQLSDARREYLEELRESEGAGFGFDKGWDWVMRETAALLANAQQGEQNLIAGMLGGWEIPIHRMPDLLEALNTTMYDGIGQIVDAIYDAIRGVPSFARGGIVMRGPKLVRVAEYVPEAIVPLSKLANMMPYRRQSVTAASSAVVNPDWQERASLARLSSVERSNAQIAQAMVSIQRDINAMRRQR